MSSCSSESSVDTILGGSGDGCITNIAANESRSLDFLGVDILLLMFDEVLCI
jgi:hypothetical protein